MRWVDLKSAFFGTQYDARQMIKQRGGGHIINISSVHEDWPMPGNVAYYCAKGAVQMLTRTAGVELAPHHILVVNVGPEAVNTPITPPWLTRLKQQGSTPPYLWGEWPSPVRSLTWWCGEPPTRPVTPPPLPSSSTGLMEGSVSL